MATSPNVACAADAGASPSSIHPFQSSLDRLAISNHATPGALDHDASIPADPRPANPPFVFPASPASPSTTPASRQRRRPVSMVDLQSRSSATDINRAPGPAALPQFSFNPGAALPADPDSMMTLSPPITPNSARPIPSPSRPAGHGHRRGGSEFVGGSIRDGSSIAVMSTSPTKSESGFPSPGLHPPRRGHRRGVSGTISTNDLPILHPQPDFLRQKGSSAPNSPIAFNPRETALLPLDHQPSPLPEPANAVPLQAANATEENTINNHSITVPTSPARPEPIPRQSRPGRARVGFSDTLEFIPRPLSLVSSDTSSTVTARPGHSVSGSISSLVSAASPGPHESPAPLTRSPTRETVDSRPSTAGAILERTSDFKAVAAGVNTSPRRRNSIPTLLDMASSQATGAPSPSPTKTPKRWSFFGLDPFISSAPASKHRSSSSDSSESVSKTVPGGFPSDHESDSSGDEATGDNSTSSKRGRKKASKKKRVKGWAGSILPLRSNKKRSKVHAVRPPTPPASVGPVEDEDDENEALESAETGISPVPVPSPAPPVLTITESPPLEEPSAPKQRSEEESAYPMIDLDAALGPFNTPLPHNPEWDAAQRAAGNVNKRRLHSAQGLKGFSGPGMHYHRRAESAPDLPPFDPGRAGIHRFGSSSTMADVFEEDEEDDVGEGEMKPDQDEDGPKAPVAAGDDDSDGEITPPATEPAPDSLVHDVDDLPAAAIRRRASSGTCNTDNSASVHAVRTECSRTSLHEEVIAEEHPSIIFRGASLFPAAPIDQQDSASSSPRLPHGLRELSPVEVNQTVPLSPYSTSHASSYPSPRSPMSMDAQRISTAPSSVTDETSFHSLLMGEPGPEVRISVDYDIPSLTSSTSTMTRESAFIPNARMSQPSLREQRPSSVSSAAFGRRRSSLVSLSRLISSSHGERSKLSMEVTLDNETEGKRSRSKSSKTKRLGRMMQFWKPSKEPGPT
ncbi:cell wall proline rich protein [Pochonia chlamydosporia 170]|uniref:Cell wall proline rich protein n=1 Tax=Pochonia chlamydosporia 170 TaxID=1380566 RepID=A0A179FZY4_METCM|nr:cell wall proline rich protein [Pochonia chlamydosporia 170]OAQ70613.1 cell wall proline rich protein [Pochonia chlamydosporia 170]